MLVQVAYRICVQRSSTQTSSSDGPRVNVSALAMTKVLIQFKVTTMLTYSKVCFKLIKRVKQVHDFCSDDAINSSAQMWDDGTTDPRSSRKIITQCLEVFEFTKHHRKLIDSKSGTTDYQPVYRL